MAGAFAALSWFCWFAGVHPAWRTLATLLLFVVGGITGALGIKLRAFLAEMVVRHMLLPATNMAPGRRLSAGGGGRAITVADATMMMR